MTGAPSPDGRRILVAVVTGDTGARIQAWREEHDPEQAKRLPPHATLCYWAPPVLPERVEQQVRRAFPAPFDVRLGRVRKGDNDQETFYVEVLDRKPLDRALACLYDGTHVALPERRPDWLWHVTCVRESRGRDQEALLAAAESLCLEDTPWTVNQIAYMQLHGDAYVPLACWEIKG
jgi:2'-5' RNA ligase superfamily protein